MLSMKELNDTVEKSSDQDVKKQVIDRMQQITDKCKRINLSPVQTTLEFVPTKDPLLLIGFLCSIAVPHPDNCDVPEFPRYVIKGIKSKFTNFTKDESNNHCSKRGSQVSVQLEGVNDDTTQVRDNNDGSYMASFVPQQVGEVKLSVFVNGEQIKGSPYSVMVRDYTRTSINKPRKI